MSDHHAGYVVTLDESLGEATSRKTMDAIMMIQGVIAIEPVVSDIPIAIAMARAKARIGNKIIEALMEAMK